SGWFGVGWGVSPPCAARSRPRLEVERLEGRDVPASYLDNIQAQAASSFAQLYSTPAECRQAVLDPVNPIIKSLLARFPEFSGTIRSAAQTGINIATSACDLLAVGPKAQSSFGVAPRNLRVPLKQSGFAAWKKQAKQLAKKMQDFLPAGHTFAVTSV